MHKRRLHADKAAKAGVAALELLHHEAVFHVGHAGAAIALEVGAEEAKLAHDGDKFARKALCSKAFLDDRDQVVFDEIARGTANQQFIFAEACIEMEKVNALKFESHDCTLPFCVAQTCKASRCRLGRARLQLSRVVVHRVVMLSKGGLSGKPGA